jgi:hypothetical protein
MEKLGGEGVPFSSSGLSLCSGRSVSSVASSGGAALL